MKVPKVKGDKEFKGKMRKVRRTRQDPCKQDRRCHQSTDSATHQNTVTHWWDASQLYGSDEATNARVRAFSDGKLVLASNGRLPVDRKSGLPITGE